MDKKITINKLNEEKARTWYAEKHGLSEIQKEDLNFFTNLEEVFEYVYLDDRDSHQDTINTLRQISNIDVNSIIEAGAKNIAEYLALSWGWLEITPYGYIGINSL